MTKEYWITEPMILLRAYSIYRKPSESSREWIIGWRTCSIWHKFNRLRAVCFFFLVSRAKRARCLNGHTRDWRHGEALFSPWRLSKIFSLNVKQKRDSLAKVQDGQMSPWIGWNWWFFVKTRNGTCITTGKRGFSSWTRVVVYIIPFRPSSQ